ncbi:MAG: DinB family protein [Bacteroidales bacterium]|nr:DinB family protein [Bacteroidales bacterium]
MKVVAKENLNQISRLLKNITIEKYTAKTEILSNASIGEHVRHIIEFYLLLVKGSLTGVISYDKRERDTQIENCKDYALQVIDKLNAGIDTLDEDKLVTLEGDYSRQGYSKQVLNSSVGRELAYCIEHSIHHQALIKAATVNINISHILDKNFGLAYSTIRYRKNQCAQ